MRIPKKITALPTVSTIKNADWFALVQDGVTSKVTFDDLNKAIGDEWVTGGTYNPDTGCGTFSTNSGHTFVVCGFLTGYTDSYTTGATLNGGVIEFGNTLFGDNFYSVDIGDLSFSGGSGTCITDLYITNLHGCTPVTVHDNLQHVGSFATGINSIAWGSGTTASGDYSHAEGFLTQAIGNGSHAEGSGATASGDFSHAEGNSTAEGVGTHAEGYLTLASGNVSHSEGDQTIASGGNSHAQNCGVIAAGLCSHAGGMVFSGQKNTSLEGTVRIIASGETSFVHYKQTQSANGCDLPPNSISVTPAGEIIYNIPVPGVDSGGVTISGIGGFQFDVVPATVIGVTGGDWGNVGGTFNVGGGTTIIGTGGTLTCISNGGCGTLGMVDSTLPITGITNIVFTNCCTFTGTSICPAHPCVGCMDPIAVNYEANATVNCGCEYFIDYIPASGITYAKTIGAYGDSSVILGGINHNIGIGGDSSGIFAGENNIINTGITRSVILGGDNITASQSDTAYVPQLNIKTLGSNPSVTNLGRDASGNVVAGSGTFTGNTTGDCINDIHVKNIHSCSDLTINNADEGDVTFGSTGGVSISVTGESVTATDLHVGEYIYHKDEPNTNIRFTPDRIRITAGSTEYICIQDDPPGPLTGEIVFNEGGAQIKTRIESVGNENLFVVNGLSAFNSIGINSTGRTDVILHVSGDTRFDGSIKMVDGNEGSGKVLTSDANGVGSWQTSSGGGTFTGNTSATCIDTLWVSTISGCSPVTIGSELKIQTNDNTTSTDAFSITNSDGHKLLSMTNKDGVTGGLIVNNMATNNLGGTVHFGSSDSPPTGFISMYATGADQSIYSIPPNLANQDLSRISFRVDNEKGFNLYPQKDTYDGLNNRTAIEIPLVNSSANPTGLDFITSGSHTLSFVTTPFIRFYSWDGVTPNTNIERLRIDHGSSDTGETRANISMINSWVGINTLTPDTGSTLHVSGKTKTSNFQMTSGPTAGYVLTSDVSGNASWQPSSGSSGTFTGNTSGTCIDLLWVSTISGCSPVTIGSSIQSSTATASGINSMSYGFETVASGEYSHAEGKSTSATGSTAHAEGEDTMAYGEDSHAEGKGTTASGEQSHAEGGITQAIGGASHAEGAGTIAFGDASHSEGEETQAIGKGSHAEGFLTVASGDYSHAGGSGYGVSGTSIVVSGRSAFAHFEQTESPILPGLGNAGTYGDNTAIIGGKNHWIGGIDFVAVAMTTGSTGSVIMGGDRCLILNSFQSGILCNYHGMILNSANSFIIGGEEQNIQNQVTGTTTFPGPGLSAVTQAHIGSNSLLGGSDNTIGNGKNSTIVGGSGNSISGQTGSLYDSPFKFCDGSIIVGGSGNQIQGAWGAAILGGGYAFGGGVNIIGPGADKSVILGGTNIRATSPNTAYVPNLNIGTVGSGTSIANIGIDASGNVVSGITFTNTFVSGGTYNGGTEELDFVGNAGFLPFSVSITPVIGPYEFGSGSDDPVQPKNGGYTNSSQGSVWLGGTVTSILGDFGFIGMGTGHETKTGAIYTFIGTGQNNTIGDDISSSVTNCAILGGAENTIEHSNTFILGSNITTAQVDTTYVENLNIGTVGSGTSVTNIGIDSAGNVTSGITEHNDFFIKRTLIKSELLALTGTPIELISAPGPGKIILPHQIHVLYKFSGTGYTADGGFNTMQIGQSGFTWMSVFNSNFEKLEDWLMTDNSSGGNGAAMYNQPLRVSSSGDGLTDPDGMANGTIQIDVHYGIMDSN